MTSRLDSLRERRAVVEQRLDTLGLLHTVSAARYQLRKEVDDAIERWVNGDVLEAGCGRSPHRSILERRAASITRLDNDPRHQPDVLADMQEMTEIDDGSFDAVLTTQVLEHIPRPLDAFRELARVLKPGGILVLTVPHLSMIHEAPHDYFRYTTFGLNELCRVSCFEIVEVHEVGGLVSFIGHIASVAFLTLVASRPGLFWVTWSFNYVLLVRLLDLLDRVFGLRSVLPRDLLLVARRY